MAITYSSAVQNKIAYRLANKAYSALTAEDKAAIDNTWSSGSPGGHVGEAYTTVRRYANFVQGGGSDDAPPDWERWLVMEAVTSASSHIAPDRFKEFDQLRREALRDAISTYTRIDADNLASTEGLAFTQQNLRLYILDACLRMEPMLLPTFGTIDSHIRKSLHDLWMAADWTWLRYADTVTIPTAGANNPTVTYASGLTPRAILSRRLYYTDADGEGQYVLWADADELNARIAEDPDDGRPQMFRVTRSASGGLNWYFERGRDQAYTVRGEFIRSPITFTSSAASTPAMFVAVDGDTVLNLTLTKSGNTLSLSPVIGGPYDLTSASYDTMAEVAAALEAIDGVTAKVLPSASGLASTLLESQTLFLNGGTDAASGYLTYAQSSNNIDTALALIPNWAQDVLKDMALAGVLETYGKTAGRTLRVRVMDDLNKLIDRDDTGEPDSESERVVTRDIVNQQLYSDDWGSGIHGGYL